MESLLKKRLLFPFDTIRDSQKEMLLAVENSVKKRRHLIVHAPTGMGKTIATLGPVLKYAKAKGKTVFFLTARHTQHLIAIETLRNIRETFNEDIKVADIIGKKWMCLQANVETLYSNEFSEFCKKLVEEDKCEFYSNLRRKGKLTTDAKLLIDKIGAIPTTEEVIAQCRDANVCPYYFTAELAQKADVIIADYFYIFNPSIREGFLKRIGKSLNDIIIIVDEGHNLGSRIRDLATARISSNIIKRAIQEAKKNKLDHHIASIANIQQFLLDKTKTLIRDSEKIVMKDDFIKHVQKNDDWAQLVSDLTFYAEDIRERQKMSYLGSLSLFLEAWEGEDEGFVRIIRSGQDEDKIVLSYRCLDPSIISREVLEQAHSVIIMSGTLTPTDMYRDLLGFPDRTDEKEYESPFDKENRLNIIVPTSTTKYTARSDKQFAQIAETVSSMTDAIPGNSAVFFPSYFVRDRVYDVMRTMSKQQFILEKQAMTKQDKEDLLSHFKKQKEKGAVLLAVAGASFSEGIDLPGDLLIASIVVGLPLSRPDLETKALISYFDAKFGRGWDYGYIFPAFNLAIQSAGRCIRGETDKGVIVFLDERYLWPKYKALFPKDWEFELAKDPVRLINEFYGKPKIT